MLASSIDKLPPCVHSVLGVMMNQHTHVAVKVMTSCQLENTEVAASPRTTQHLIAKTGKVI
jgi:hypothetical protein